LCCCVVAILLLSSVESHENAVVDPCAEYPILAPGSLNFTYWDHVVTNLVSVNTTIDGVVINSFDYARLVNNSDYFAFKCQVTNAIGMENFTHPEWKAFWINVYNYLAVRVVFEKHLCY